MIKNRYLLILFLFFLFSCKESEDHKFFNEIFIGSNSENKVLEGEDHIAYNFFDKIIPKVIYEDDFSTLKSWEEYDNASGTAYLKDGFFNITSKSLNLISPHPLANVNNTKILDFSKHFRITIDFKLNEPELSDNIGFVLDALQCRYKLLFSNNSFILNISGDEIIKKNINKNTDVTQLRIFKKGDESFIFVNKEYIGSTNKIGDCSFYNGGIHCYLEKVNSSIKIKNLKIELY